jgi:hypothetical protein
VGVKRLSLSSLEKKLDRVFSEYIRLRDSDEGGTGSCVTCGKLLFWREAHCGHFIKRQHRSVRWDERNAALQGAECNTFRGGMQDEFARAIIQRYGMSTFDELMSMKHTAKKYTRSDLEELIELYKSKLAGLTDRAAA